MVDIINIGTIMRNVVDAYSGLLNNITSTISAVSNAAIAKKEQKKIPPEDVLRTISSTILFPQNAVSDQLLEEFAKELCNDKDSIDDCLQRLDQAIFDEDRNTANIKKIYSCWVDVLLRYFTTKKYNQSFSILHISKMIYQHMLIHELLYNEYIPYLLENQYTFIDTLRCILYCTVQHTKYISVAIKSGQIDKLDPQQQANIIADLTLWHSRILRTYYAAEEQHILLSYEIRNFFFTKLIQSTHLFITTWRSHTLHKSIAHQIEFQYETPLAAIRVYLQRYQSAALNDNPLARRSICTQLVSIFQIYECILALGVKSPQPLRNLFGVLWMQLAPSTLNKTILILANQTVALMRQIQTPNITRDVQIISDIIKKLSPRKSSEKTSHQQKKAPQNAVSKSPPKHKTIRVKSKPEPKIETEAKPINTTNTIIIETPKLPTINIQDYINDIETTLTYFENISLTQDQQKACINFTISYDDARKLLGEFLIKTNLDYDAEETPRQEMTRLFVLALFNYFNQFFRSNTTFSEVYPIVYEVSFDTLNTKCRKLPRQDDMILYLKSQLQNVGVYHEKSKKHKPSLIKQKMKATPAKSYVTTTYHDLFSDQHCQTYAPKFLATHKALFNLFEPILKAHKNIRIFIKGGLVSQSLFLLHAPKQAHTENKPCDIDLEVHGVSRDTFLTIANQHNLHKHGLGGSPYIANLCQIFALKIAGFDCAFDIDITCTEKTEITFEESSRDFIHNDALCLLSSSTNMQFIYLTDAAQSYYRLAKNTLLPSASTFNETFEQDKTRILRAMHTITAHGYNLTIDPSIIENLTQRLFDFQSPQSPDLKLFIRKIRQYTFHHQSSAMHLWHLIRTFGFFAKLIDQSQAQIETMDASWYETKISQYLLEPFFKSPHSLTVNTLITTCHMIWNAHIQEPYNRQRLFYLQQHSCEAISPQMPHSPTISH